MASCHSSSPRLHSKGASMPTSVELELAVDNPLL